VGIPYGDANTVGPIGLFVVAFIPEMRSRVTGIDSKWRLDSAKAKPPKPEPLDLSKVGSTKSVGDTIQEAVPGGGGVVVWWRLNILLQNLPNGGSKP